ncbi:MAG: hypothetical protein ACOX56_07160 [Acholeplasmataceae bacterium]
MSKRWVLKEENDTSLGLLGTILLWVLVLWWVYLLYYLIYYMYVWPIKQIVIGIRDRESEKIIIGSAIIGIYIVILIISSIQGSISSKKFQFRGLDNIEISYGESFDFLNGIELYKNNEKVEGEITFIGDVNTLALGEYDVIYTGVYQGEIITKKITVSVIPFYTNKKYNIIILEKFKITKLSDNKYEIRGKIINNSYKTYRTVKIEYHNENLNSTTNLNFNDGLIVGENEFSYIIEYEFNPIDTHSYRIKDIVCY